MAMREPMVGGVEVAAVIELRLIARVEQHRVHAVLVGQREVEDLELDRHVTRLAVRAEVDRAAVDAGGAIAADVDLDPDRLIEVGRHRDRQPAASGRAFSGTSCTGFQPSGSAGAAGEPGSKTHDACDGDRHVHVVHGEDLDRTVHRSRWDRRPVRGRRSDCRQRRTRARATSPTAIECPRRRRRRSPGTPRSRCAPRTRARCRCARRHCGAGSARLSRLILSPSPTAQTVRMPAAAGDAQRTVSRIVARARIMAGAPSGRPAAGGPSHGTTGDRVAGTRGAGSSRASAVRPSAASWRAWLINPRVEFGSPSAVSTGEYVGPNFSSASFGPVPSGGPHDDSTRASASCTSGSRLASVIACGASGMPGPMFVRPSTIGRAASQSPGRGRRASGERARGHQHALGPGAAFLGREVSIAEQRVHSGVAALGFRQRQPVDQRRRQRRLIGIALERGGSLRRRRLARAERGVERRVDLDVARVVGDAFREHVDGSVRRARSAATSCRGSVRAWVSPRHASAPGSNPRWPHRTARRRGAARRAGTSPGHRRDWPRAPRAARHNCCAGSGTRRSAAGARPPGSRRCPNRPIFWRTKPR